MTLKNRLSYIFTFLFAISGKPTSVKSAVTLSDMPRIGRFEKNTGINYVFSSRHIVYKREILQDKAKVRVSYFGKFRVAKTAYIPPVKLISAPRYIINAADYM